MNAINGQFQNLEAYNAEIVYLSAEKLEAAYANIKKLDAEKISADYADLKYATINFSNIDIAAVEKLFTESGIIRDLVVKDQKITGKLVGVTISGDLIEGNTITADKLVVLGEDGVYYKLNIDGLDKVSTTQVSMFDLLTTQPENWETNFRDYYYIYDEQYAHPKTDTAPTWQPNTYYKLSDLHKKGLNGTNIIAHTITADRIDVSDLVAFDATIGGFTIEKDSIHTHTKNSIDANISGLYFGKDGQIYIGDDENQIKYYKDTKTGKWKLSIKANELRLTSTGKTIEEEITQIKNEVTTFLQIESSKGTVFKNDQVSTLLTVAIYRGSDRITDMTTLRSKMGNNVYLQWKWKRLNDEEYGIISSDDKRISQDGFMFTLSPEDVDTKVTFLCELID